jgi:hypothetical protein
MIRLLVYLLILTAGLQTATAQILRTIDKLPDELKENSGMAYYANGIIYFIQDSGNPNELYRYDTASKKYTTKILKGVANVDYEELATDPSGNLYIGDFGNNSNDRTNLKIYKTSNPETSNEDSLSVETIRFTFSNQTEFPPASEKLNFDCEAMCWWQDSLYLFTKNRTNPFDGWCYMYVVPAIAGTYAAELRDSIKFDGITKEYGWITAADVRADTLILLSSSSVHLATGFGKSSLSQLSWQRYDVGFSQKEAIAFGTHSSEIFISDEFYFVGNNLYFFDLKGFTNEVFTMRLPYFKAYHSPAHLRIVVSMAEEAYVSIYDMQGSHIVATTFINELEIGGSQMAFGTYLVTIKVGQRASRFKWVKSE